MKKILLALLLLAPAGLASAAEADVNGSWLLTIKTRGAPQLMTLTLKSDGDGITGTIGPGRSRGTEIFNGKLEGNKLSFSTSRRGRRDGDEILWQAKIKGSEMKGTRRRKEARRGVPFTAVKEEER